MKNFSKCAIVGLVIEMISEMIMEKYFLIISSIKSSYPFIRPIVFSTEMHPAYLLFHIVL